MNRMVLAIASGFFGILCLASCGNEKLQKVIGENDFDKIEVRYQDSLIEITANGPLWTLVKCPDGYCDENGLFLSATKDTSYQYSRYEANYSTVISDCYLSDCLRTTTTFRHTHEGKRWMMKIIYDKQYAIKKIIKNEYALYCVPSYDHIILFQAGNKER